MGNTIMHNKAKCKKCDSVIESIHRHDWKSCKCGAIFVDGGKSYIRRGGKLEDIEELSEFILTESEANTA
jgi:hypothetical protein